MSKIISAALVLLLGSLLAAPLSTLAKTKRSTAARRQFLRITGYPNGRPGYIVDHMVPLQCGGADNPSNMQWQTVAEAKAKDKTESRCRIDPRYRTRSYESRVSRYKNVYVRGYYTKSGRYVLPHYRSRPRRRR